jgi:S-adenosylmethionine:tRNA ribosyltransferase-isomerase
MRTADFDYDLPPDLIAQHPAEKRDASRLLVVNRSDGRFEHRRFRDFPDFLSPGDVLVINDSRVIPARLRAVKPESGGSVEVLLLEEVGENEWWVMLKPGKRVRQGTLLKFLDKTNQPTPLQAEVLDKSSEGHYRLKFDGTEDLQTVIQNIGEMPLPPYIRRSEGAGSIDEERYQTVFAQPAGSVAAPTAGLHFTKELLQNIRARGVQTVSVTLHVGLGTFAPVKTETLDEHRMHEERYFVSEEAATAINAARKEGRRVFAVGTTSLRVLESVAALHGEVKCGAGRTRLFVHPPCEFKVVDALLTNFHLPKSTLLMLVSAFAAPGKIEGRDLIMQAYQEAIRERYRFFSYGDAMLIV